MVERVLQSIPERVKKALVTAVTVALAFAAGSIAFAAFARSTYPIGPARVTVQVRPGTAGTTTLALPPFGEVRAATHSTPVRLQATLQEVDLDSLQRMAADGLPELTDRDRLRDELTSGVYGAAGKGLLAAFAASGLAALLLRRSWRHAALSAALGVIVPAVLLGGTAATYDAHAFARPTYRGSVSYAPQLIRLVQQKTDNVQDMQRQVSRFATQLAAYYRRPQSFDNGGDMAGTIRVLHVSDLHLDPVGFKLTDELAKQYRASAVIDTGDVQTLGTPLESTVLAKTLKFARPRVFVAGNHDSPELMRNLEAMPNATVLDHESTRVAGLTVYGLADPAARTASFEPDSRAVSEEASRFSGKLRRAIREGGATPDIIGVHSPEQAKAFDGIAPIILTGHTHKPSLRRSKSLRLNAGTTGGVDFGLRADGHVPHSAAVLYYTREMPRRLIAIDQIEAFGVNGQSSVKRTVVDEKLLP